MSEEKIRLGGMALPNGVLVHGPHSLGVRDPASGRPARGCVRAEALSCS